MPNSFLKQWNSTSKQIWFQAAVDACATARTGSSTAPEMADLFQRTSVPFCAPIWCTHLPSWEGTIWWPLSGMTRAQTGPRACKSSSETAVVVTFPSWTLWGSSGTLYIYIQLFVDMLSIGWEGCMCGITQFIVVAVVVVADAVALWQTHTVGWEDCVCPFILIFIILPTPPS